MHADTEKRHGPRQGEIRRALLHAVAALATPEKGPSLRELAAHACVGLDAARRTLNNMCRAGDVVIARTRRVPYRNRPVAEYALPGPGLARDDAEPAAHGLGALLAAWGACPAPKAAITPRP